MRRLIRAIGDSDTGRVTLSIFIIQELARWRYAGARRCRWRISSSAALNPNFSIVYFQLRMQPMTLGEGTLHSRVARSLIRHRQAARQSPDQRRAEASMKRGRSSDGLRGRSVIRASDYEPRDGWFFAAPPYPLRCESLVRCEAMPIRASMTTTGRWLDYSRGADAQSEKRRGVVVPRPRLPETK